MIKKEIEGAALLSIYNELKDEIKAIRTDIQNLNIQQPQQSENNQELNSLLKETIVNAVNDTINAHINSRENYADEVSRRCKNTIDFAIERETKLGLLAHFTQIYHLYNLLIYNILRRNLQLFITEFCIFSPCIIFISNKNSDKSIEILHISPKYITSVDNLMIHIFSSTFNFLYSFTPSDRLESKS